MIGWRRFLGAALAVLVGVAVVAGCGPTAASRTSTAPGSAPGSGSVAGADSGLSVVALSSLPTQATDTVRRIQRGGPFASRQDGTVFGNREGMLPREPGGYYHEYTVTTPGSDDRGARRIARRVLLHR